jgi:hypothetical protein
MNLYSNRLLAFLSLAGITHASYSTESDYAPGFTWDSIQDWTPGTTLGTSEDNPDDDLNGNPTWVCANVYGGGSLASENPWYEQPYALQDCLIINEPQPA